MDRALTYKTVTFRKNGNSRFVASASIIPGWNRLQEVPKLLDVSSISILDPASPLKISMKAFRDFEALLEPSMPTEVEVVSATNQMYSGLLVKKTPTVVSLVTDKGLVEISAPYVLSYSRCLSGDCRSVVPRVSLYFENIPLDTSERVDLTFVAGGFSWEASYKAILDLERHTMLSFVGEIQCRNDTDLLLDNVEVAFMSKSDEESYGRPLMAMAVQRSANYVSSEQTMAGSAIYRLNQRVRIPEKSLASFKFVEFGDFTVSVESRFNILQQPTHPLTMVKLQLPSDIVDGIPAGPVECWDGTTWLATSHIQMTAPDQWMVLNLGENAFVTLKIEMVVNRIEDSVETNRTVERSLYKVSVSIENRSKYLVYLVPYHPIDREVKDLKVTPKLLINEYTPFDGSGKEIQFTVPAMKPDTTFAFEYTMTS
jgi:hypothetical protein